MVAANSSSSLSGSSSQASQSLSHIQVAGWMIPDLHGTRDCCTAVMYTQWHLASSVSDQDSARASYSVQRMMFMIVSTGLIRSTPVEGCDSAAAGLVHVGKSKSVVKCLLERLRRHRY